MSRTFRIFLALLALFALLTSPAALWNDYLDTPIGLALALPFLSVYIFHSLGIPGLLQNGGACGWSWCAPTTFGWVFITVFWLAIAYGLAALIALLTKRAD